MKPIYRTLFFNVIPALLLFASNFLYCQQPATKLSVQIGKNILVGKEGTGKTFLEPGLSAHPKNADHLVAVGWIHSTTDGPVDSLGHCAVFLSEDGGQTWSRRDIGCITCQDPWISISDRVAILSTMGKHPLLPESRDQLLVYFSSDGGKTWNDVPQSLGSGHDGPRTTVAADGTIYLVTNQIMANGNNILVGRVRPGRKYVDVMSRTVPSNLNLLADASTVLHNGNLLLTYHDFQQKKNGNFLPTAGRLKTRRLWTITSTDKGQSFSIPKFVTDETYDRPTDMAVDTSAGEFKDRIYVAFAGQDQKSVLVTYSSNMGEEWSDPMAFEPAAMSIQSRLSVKLAVNNRGVVAVAWMDRRDDPKGKCFAPYISFSVDGGKTFSEAHKVADAISCPDSTRLKFPGRRWPVGGEYFGLTGAADGKFHILWPDARSGSFELMTSSIVVSSQN